MDWGAWENDAIFCGAHRRAPSGRRSRVITLFQFGFSAVGAGPGRGALERSRRLVILSRQTRVLTQSREAAKQRRRKIENPTDGAISGRQDCGIGIAGQRLLCEIVLRLGVSVRTSGLRSPVILGLNSLRVELVRDALRLNDRGGLWSSPDKTRGSHAKPPSRKEEKTQNRASHPSRHFTETRLAASGFPANEFLARSFCDFA